jgi:putative transposase
MPKRKRRSIRLPGYDYTSPGAYFVTVVAYQRELLFGEIVDEEMILNARGRIVWECWYEIPKHFSHVKLGAFVAMPNHVHGIIEIVDNDTVGAQHAAPLLPKNNVIPGSLGAIVRSFKSAVTKRVNEKYDSPGTALWQRNYYEHIIRNEQDWERIHDYILANPANWGDDKENPKNDTV